MLRLVGRWSMVAVALALLSSSALADKDKAKAEYVAGSKSYDLNEFAAALEHFKNAYREESDPALLFNIAQCHRQLGDKQKAVGFYQSFLRKLPDAPNAADVRQRINSLQNEIASEQRSKSEPPQGTIAPGAKPEPSPQPAPTPPPATAPVTEAAPRPWYSSSGAIGSFVVFGVGVAALATGGGLAAHGIDLASQAQNAATLSQQQQLNSDASTYKNAGWAMLAIGGAAIVGGATGIGLIESRRHTKVSMHVSPLGAGMVVGGSF